MVTEHESWPALPYDEWKDTYATLHMWTQIVGKVALALAPPLNQSWGIALQLTPRGLSTRTLPYANRTFTMEFDFLDHRLAIRASDGLVEHVELAPRSVADFYADVRSKLKTMGLAVKMWPMPVEVPTPVRFDKDEQHHTYDPAHARRCWTILSLVAQVLEGSRCRFVGKCSPVNFYWGSFDLAVTRFSGRPAPPREGPAFMREAYSQEVISHGFWFGSGLVLEPAFYAYAVPEPPGLKAARVQPDAVYYHGELGEFVLPYEVVRTSGSPQHAVESFVNSTYDRAATLAQWDRTLLERSSV